MGKPSDLVPAPSPSPGPTQFTEPASAISLRPTPAASSPASHNTSYNHHGQPYFNDDPAELVGDDLPPLYEERNNRVVVDPLAPSGICSCIPLESFTRDPRSDTLYYLYDHRAYTSGDVEHSLNLLSRMPPRPFVHVRGTHVETRQRSSDNDRSEQVQVVDFDIEMELTPLFYFDVRNPQNGAWRDLRAVGNLEKVRRGTVFPTRAPGFGGSGVASETGESSVSDWCDAFCDSRAGLKVLAFERRVVGWDWDYLQRQLERLVRDTNYRGHLEVSFPVRDARVEIYNDCRTNRWRLTRWIEVIFVLTLTFLVAWPWLFFRTKRWETVYVEWQMSRDEDSGDGAGGRTRRYATMSEAQWYNMWARPIQKAVLERRQGQLDQGDVERGQYEPEERAPGFAGMVRAGVEAMGVVDRSFGWGGDVGGRSGGSRGRFGGVRMGIPSRR